MKHQSYIQTKSNHPNVNHVNCLICGKRIPSERIVGNLAICTCGWASSSRAHIFESRREWSTSLSLSMAAILLLLATLHLVQWDKFAFEVLLIKGKQIAGLIQVTDLERKAQICEERIKLDCIVATMSQLHAFRPKEAAYLGKLAHAQAKLGKWEAAEASFAEYVLLDGHEYEYLYEYAKVLGRKGKIDLASSIFDKVLAMKPQMLQIQVARTYVNLLMENSRYDQARSIIEKFRHLGQNAAYFLDEEMQEIQKRTATQSS